MSSFPIDCCESHVSRRSLLMGGVALAASACLPRFAWAKDGRDPRFVTIMLRGALDGLSTVVPVGDPDYAGLNGSMALLCAGVYAATALDSFFALHPAMSNFARMYKEKNAAVIHAVATPYRGRSHFDGQDVLESGLAGPGRLQSGWLNRALEALLRGERSMRALGVGPVTPLILRGAAPTIGWVPPILPQAADTNAMRFAAKGAAHLMARGDGPRIAALAFDGWDTHANAGGPTGQLAQLLSSLDGALAEFEAGLGARWRDTVIVVVTEFGRTARINGTLGTDHGTGTVALLAGGAVNGGRVISDWPGLKLANLYEGRDLKPTTDLRGVIKGILRDHLGLGERVLADAVFPDSATVTAMQGLVV